MTTFNMARLGTHVSVGTSTKVLGSLGVVVDLPDGPYAVTAGHVVRMARGADLFAKTATTTLGLGKPIVTLYDELEDLDLALIGPIDGDVSAVAGELVFARNPNVSDLNTRFSVYRPTDFFPVVSWVHQWNVAADFFRVDGPGLIRLENLASLDDVTDAGDSGGAVLDDLSNLVGFVVGSDGLRTYILPAERGLNALARHLPQ